MSLSESAAADDSDEVRTRAAVERFYEGIFAADFALVEEVLQPDVVVSEPRSLPTAVRTPGSMPS
jgi:hypothetical protein